MSPTHSKEPQRIAKLLARAGVASRREIERMIAEGRVALDGKTLDTPATLLTSLHGVTVDGNPVAAPAPARLFRFHKPSGVLTAERDFTGRETIYDRLPQTLPRVVPVGRLDLNTEGLLLLTTDGGLKRELELPSTGVERSYRARAYGDVTQAQLEDLMLGVEIEGVRYGSINANLERRTGANVWIEMTLTEGKNREVRRVLEYLGLQVSRLIRTRYGPFYLGDLESGEVDEIRQHDLIAFRKVLSQPGGGKAASNLQFAHKPRPAPAPAAKEDAPEPGGNRAERRASAGRVEPEGLRRKAAPRPAAAASKTAPAAPRTRANPAEGAEGTAAPTRIRYAKRAEERPRAATPARPGKDGEARKPRGTEVRKPVSRAEREAEDRASFVDRPKRYRAGDRRPRKPAAPKGPKR